MRIEQPIRRTVPSGRTSGARRLAFERLEDRLALDAASFGALDYSSDAALCSDGFHDPPIALISQDRYYVQENCSVCVSGEGSAGNDLRYFWYLGPQPTESRELFVELGEYFWLSASQLDLGTGDYSLQLYVQDSSGASSETVVGALTITPSEPSFTIDADHSLDPGALVLNVQAHSYYPISTWTIDWGDGSTTQTDALGFELAAAHFYPQIADDAVYTATLAVVDSLGRGGEQVYELVTVDVPGVDPFSSFVVDAFYDAEKGSYTQSQICWAAGTANVLYYTGWANPTITADQGGSNVSFINEEDVYDYLAQSFQNIGSSSLYGYQWFITGNYQAAGVAGWAQPDPGSGGFHTDVENFWSLTSYNSYASSSNPTSIFPKIDGLLQSGYGATASLGFYSNNPGSTLLLAHTVTLWGFETDATYEKNDPRHYSAIYITDSDNDAYQGRSAPNTLHKVYVRWDNEYGRYCLTDYRTGVCWLEELIALAPITSILGEGA